MAAGIFDGYVRIDKDVSTLNLAFADGTTDWWINAGAGNLVLATQTSNPGSGLVLAPDGSAVLTGYGPFVQIVRTGTPNREALLGVVNSTGDTALSNSNGDLTVDSAGNIELDATTDVILQPSTAETARFQGSGGLTFKEKSSGPATAADQGSLWVYNSNAARPYFIGGHSSSAEQRPLVQGPLAADPSTALVTDNRIARFDGTTGGIVQGSDISIDDNGNLILTNSDSIYWNNSSSNTYISGASSGALTLKGSTAVEVDAVHLHLTSGFAIRWGGSSATSIAGSSSAGGDLTLAANDDIFLNAADDVVVQVGGTTYATFDGTNGYLGVGTATPANIFQARGSVSSGFVARVTNDSTASTADGLVIQIEVAAANSGNQFIRFADGTSEIGSITGDGTGVDYNQTSDERLKENITDAPSLLAKLGALRVREFAYKRRPGSRKVGFIAQELAEVWPYATSNPAVRNERQVVVVERTSPKGEVSREERVLDADSLETLRADERFRVVSVAPLTEDHPEYSFWGVDYSKLTPLLVKAGQEQQALIERLQAQVAKQDALIATLLARLDALEKR